jgi:hypothetical protein
MGDEQQQHHPPPLPADDGRIVPIAVYPRTRLTTLIATRLGLSFYRDLPAPGYELPVLDVPFVLPARFRQRAKKSPPRMYITFRVNHHLQAPMGFRSACRHHFKGEQPALEAHLVALADRWLAFAGTPRPSRPNQLCSA